MRLPKRLTTPSSLLALGAGVLAVPLLMVAVLPRLGTASVAAASLPDPATDSAVAPGGRATAVLAGGCFWGMEAVFEHVRGVSEVVTGYAGGSKTTAAYERVKSGDTGHAEGIRITYDPEKISYGQLLKVFFAVAHDPTERNRQGPDVGPQYRSAIFPTDPEQRRVATAYISQLNRAGVFPRAHRHHGGGLAGLHPRRGLPPGLRGPQPRPPLRGDPRQAQGGEAESGVPGVVPLRGSRSAQVVEAAAAVKFGQLRHSHRWPGDR